MDFSFRFSADPSPQDLSSQTGIFGGGLPAPKELPTTQHQSHLSTKGRNNEWQATGTGVMIALPER